MEILKEYFNVLDENQGQELDGKIDTTLVQFEVGASSRLSSASFLATLWWPQDSRKSLLSAKK